MCMIISISLSLCMYIYIYIYIYAIYVYVKFGSIKIERYSTAQALFVHYLARVPKP